MYKKKKTYFSFLVFIYNLFAYRQYLTLETHVYNNNSINDTKLFHIQQQVDKHSRLLDIIVDWLALRWTEEKQTFMKNSEQ